MAGTYTRQLFVGASPVSGNLLIGTVPAGKVWVLRCVTCYMNVGSGADAQLLAPEQTNAVVYFDYNAGGRYREWEGRIALYAGQQVFLATKPWGARWSVTAYELEASPAP